VLMLTPHVFISINKLQVRIAKTESQGRRKHHKCQNVILGEKIDLSLFSPAHLIVIARNTRESGVLIWFGIHTTDGRS